MHKMLIAGALLVGLSLARPAAADAGFFFSFSQPGFGIAVGSPYHRPYYYPPPVAYVPPPVAFVPPPVVFGGYYPRHHWHGHGHGWGHGYRSHGRRWR